MRHPPSHRLLYVASAQQFTAIAMSAMVARGREADLVHGLLSNMDDAQLCAFFGAAFALGYGSSKLLTRSRRLR